MQHTIATTTELLTELFKSVRQVFGKLKGEQRLALGQALGLMACASALASGVPLLLGRLVDAMQADASQASSIALKFLSALLIMIAVREGLQIWRRRLVESVATDIEMRQRVHLTEHLLKTRLDLLQGHRVGSLQGRLNRDVEGFVKLIKLAFQDLLPALFICVSALLVVAVTLPFGLTFTMLLVVPTGLAVVFVQIASQKGIRIDLLAQKSTLDGITVELLGHVESVRAFNGEAKEIGMVSKESGKLRNSEMRHHVAMAYFDAIKYVNEGVFLVATIAVAIAYASVGKISVGDVLAVALLFNSVVTPLREMHRLLDDAHEATLRTQDLLEMFSWEIDRAYRTETIGIPRAPNVAEVARAGHLEFANVWFGYTGRPPLLRGINLSVPQGTRAGLVGLSGSGKSTLLRLPLGLLHPTEGCVMLDNRRVGDYSRDILTERMLLISQTPFVVSGTVLDNVAYAKPDASEADVEEALASAELLDRVRTLPGGLHAAIGERGSNLSGGERQRLALARAFLCPPDILLLDEAPSALDNERADRIIARLIHAMRGKTILIVSHKLSIMRNMDNVCVLDGGVLADSGSYDELLGRGGLFRELAQREGVATERLTLAA